MTPEQQEGYRNDREPRRAPGPSKILVTQPESSESRGAIWRPFPCRPLPLTVIREIAVCVITSRFHSAYPTSARERRGKDPGCPLKRSKQSLPAYSHHSRTNASRLSTKMAMALANGRWVPRGLYDRAVKALDHVGITHQFFTVTWPLQQRRDDPGILRRSSPKPPAWRAEGVAPSAVSFPDTMSVDACRPSAPSAPLRRSGQHRGSIWEYVKLGRTGLDVSRIVPGCMSYGGSNRGNFLWSLGEAASRPFIKRALEAGINFFDTANRYSLGICEEILGRAIKDFACREEVVIATKVYGRMRSGPNGAGLSRKAIMVEIDASLQRLGTDYVSTPARSIAGTMTPRSKRRWKRCTTSGRWVRPGISVPPPSIARGSSPAPWAASPSATAGPASSPCRTSSTCFTARRNADAAALRRGRHRGHPMEVRRRAAEHGPAIGTTAACAPRLTRRFDGYSQRPKYVDRKVIDRVAQAAAAGAGSPPWPSPGLGAMPIVTAPIVGATLLEHLDGAVASVQGPETIGRRDHSSGGALRPPRGCWFCLS